MLLVKHKEEAFAFQPVDHPVGERRPVIELGVDIRNQLAPFGIRNAGHDLSIIVHQYDADNDMLRFKTVLDVSLLGHVEQDKAIGLLLLFGIDPLINNRINLILQRDFSYAVFLRVVDLRKLWKIAGDRVTDQLVVIQQVTDRGVKPNN